MKCIKSNSTGEVVRVKDVLAAVRVKNGDWVYCPKSEFKKKNDVEQGSIKKTNKKTKRKSKYENVSKELSNEQEETETTEEETEES